MTATISRTSGKPRVRRKRPKPPSIWTQLAALLRSPFGDLLIALGLFLLALVIRWPYLLRLPHFTDETVEIEWALRIWRGEITPLTASDRYYGPLHAYIVAACLWLFGPSITLPRAIVMVFGALTVVGTYFLGRTLVNRVVGLLGAGLLATAAQHIIVNSHVAWQNSTTPFYAVLTFLCLTLYLQRVVAARAVADEANQGLTLRQGGFWAVLAGFCYGLMLNTHVGTIVLAPALVVTVFLVIWRARAWGVLRTPALWLAPLAGMLAYGPVILYNLMHNLAGVHRVRTRRSYAYEMDLSPTKYLQNMRDLWLELLRMVSNPIRVPKEFVHYLTSPFLLLMAGLCGVGLVLLLKRRQPLALCAVLSTALIMPAFNKAYGQDWDRHMLTGRYITFLLPLVFIAAGYTLYIIFGLAERLLQRNWPRPRLRLVLLSVVAPVVLLLIAYPLLPLAQYYRLEAADDPANASVLATVRHIQAIRSPQTPVLIGRKFTSIDLKDGADMRQIFDLLFDLAQVPHVSPENTYLGIEHHVKNAPPGDPEALPLIIMMRDECWQMGDRSHFQRVSERYLLRELYWSGRSYYAVYRYVPEGQPGNCAPATGPEPGE